MLWETWALEVLWGMGLHEVVASLAPRKTGGFDSHILHQ